MGVIILYYIKLFPEVPLGLKFWAWNRVNLSFSWGSPLSNVFGEKTEIRSVEMGVSVSPFKTEIWEA